MRIHVLNFLFTALFQVFILTTDRIWPTYTYITISTKEIQSNNPMNHFLGISLIRSVVDVSRVAMPTRTVLLPGRCWGVNWGLSVYPTAG